MLQVQCSVLLSLLSALTPLHGDLIQAHFFQFHIPVDLSQMYASRVHISSGAQTCTSKHCPTWLSNRHLRLLLLKAQLLVCSSPLSHRPCVWWQQCPGCTGQQLGVILDVSLSNPSSSQSGGPVGSASGIPDSDTHTPPPPPAPWSTHLDYYSSHLTGLPASLAALPT